ncbi:MAG: DUF1697 domain-containing protein [Planctomycetes bacterium]|nr:DUF1697 domain-containing protein [Planctomycetota bacterium]
MLKKLANAKIDEHRHVALLRGINVAGQKIIKMEALAGAFRSLRFENVVTYIQSGNVLFDADARDESALAARIEAGLQRTLGHRIEIFLRTADEMRAIAAIEPFIKYNEDNAPKPYITFISGAPPKVSKLPLVSPRKDVEVIRVSGREFYTIARRIDGRPGFPNKFIEDTFDVRATTRNWNTVVKLSKMA